MPSVLAPIFWFGLAAACFLGAQRILLEIHIANLRAEYDRRAAEEAAS